MIMNQALSGGGERVYKIGGDGPTVLGLPTAAEAGAFLEGIYEGRFSGASIFTKYSLKNIPYAVTPGPAASIYVHFVMPAEDVDILIS